MLVNMLLADCCYAITVRLVIITGHLTTNRPTSSHADSYTKRTKPEGQVRTPRDTPYARITDRAQQGKRRQFSWSTFPHDIRHPRATIRRCSRKMSFVCLEVFSCRDTFSKPFFIEALNIQNGGGLASGQSSPRLQNDLFSSQRSGLF